MRIYTRKLIVEAINYWRKQKMLLEGNDKPFDAYKFILFDNKKDKMMEALTQAYEKFNDRCKIYIQFASSLNNRPLMQSIDPLYCQDGMLLCSEFGGESADLGNVFGKLYNKFNESFKNLKSIVFVNAKYDISTNTSYENLNISNFIQYIINGDQNNIKRFIDNYNEFARRSGQDKIISIYYLNDIVFENDKLIFLLRRIDYAQDDANAFNRSYHTNKGIFGENDATAKGIGIDFEESDATAKGIGIE